MKSIFLVIKNFVPVFLFFVLTLISCRKQQVELVPFKHNDIHSYEDLFKSFWTAMDRNYNYFSEGNIDWSDIYAKYNDKFRNLKTFNDENADRFLAMKEINLASKYFSDIRSKILDNHLVLRVEFPFPQMKKDEKITRIFDRDTQTTIDVDGGYYQTSTKGNIRIDKKKAIEGASRLFVDGTSNQDIITDDEILYALGMLKDMRDNTLYFALNKFRLSEYAIKYSDKIFPNFSPRRVYLTGGDYFEHVPDSIENEFKTGLEKIEYFMYNAMSGVINSKEYKDVLNHKNLFLTRGILDCSSIKRDWTLVGPLLTEVITQVRSKLESYSDQYKNKMSSSSLENIIGKLKNKATKILNSHNNALGEVSDCGIYDMFFNKLIDGSIKKIIIDLRGNGGGFALDRLHFIDRLISKRSLYGYERTKEGNGRFNYTPWIPVYTKTHPHGLKSPIPIVILIDKGSASMSEVTTIMLKTQDKVKVIGDYSNGAFAGLTSSEHAFNGGLQAANEYLAFYMPAMAFKDRNHKILEGIGAKPDILIIPTEDDILNGRDPALEKAIEEIDKMD
ncbi:S41 family peptidase [Ichthyobacterium seriolicida]|nr:S41 family peptidase [Ichthyobacterium seriolicida]